jgi:hypothetical protein
MTTDNSDNYAWSRTHFLDKPEERNRDERRKLSTFIADDRRSGIACRRKERQREIDKKVAFSKVTFYPNYYKVE